VDAPAKSLDRDLAKATLPQLLELQEGYASGVASLKARLAQVKAELGRRYGDSVRQALAQAEKDHGSVTLELQDGFKVKGDVKQMVKWDSAALMDVAKTLPWERVDALFKIEFSMSEKIYAGVAALSPELRAKIDAARTTKIAEPAITLIRED